MNTVGYGDISPQNDKEMLFCSFLVILACGIFAYSFNSIGLFVSEILSKENQLAEEMCIINGYMKKRKISENLGMCVQKYLEYSFKKKMKKEKFREQELINELPTNLRQKLIYEGHCKDLKKFKVILHNFSQQLLVNLPGIISEVQLMPNQVINESDEIYTSLNLIEEGEVELFAPTEKRFCNSMIKFKNILPGKTFGEKNFFSNFCSNYYFKSIGYTTILSIKKQDFLKLLDKFDKDFQKFCEIRDKIDIYNNYDNLNCFCSSCKETNHEINECHLLHFVPNKNIIFKKNSENDFQKRKTFERSNFRLKINSFLFFKKLKRVQISNLESLKKKISSSAFKKSDSDEEKSFDSSFFDFKRRKKIKNSEEKKLVEKFESVKIFDNYFINNNFDNVLKINKSFLSYSILKKNSDHLKLKNFNLKLLKENSPLLRKKSIFNKNHQRKSSVGHSIFRIIQNSIKNH